jgi:hypothetical protein
MKIVKMSLAAAVLVGASAFAIDNVKVSGNAQLFYATQDAGNASLFDKDASAADAGLNLNISADLAKNSLVTVSAGAGYTVLSTLGLENNLVSGVWGGAHTATASTNASYGNGTDGVGGAKVENANWMNEAWVALSLNELSKSTVKVGRMELDTPLAFTEKWSIEKNTFEAAVLINQDIPDTTIVAAYVGNGNGNETFGQNSRGFVQTNGLAAGAVVNANGNFTTYGSDGAYAAGIINNSWKPLTAQAWYYDVSKLVQAYWLQADLDASSLGLTGLTAGAQYSAHDIDTTGAKSGLAGYSTIVATTPIKTDSNVYALELGYAMKDMFAAKVAYSEVDKKFAAGFNTATANLNPDKGNNTAQSKLYTEAWWNYGQVTQAGAKAWNVTVTSPVNGLFDAGLYITSVDQLGAGQDMTEVTVTAGKKFGPLDATLAYISTSFNNKNTGPLLDSNMVQAYLTLNF